MALLLCILFSMSWFIFGISAQNSTFTNPILPGFYPDPSCVFVQELNQTFFCASSSFLAYPGIPVTASRDLQNWSLISHAFSRPDQLPDFAGPLTETGGIWAPTLRYREGTFYLTTTLVLDYLSINDASRWRNFVISSTNPYESASWSEPIYFQADGYDSSLFWDDDGQVYVSWATLPDVRPGIFLAPIDVNTGSVGEVVNIWNGTGGDAPEGPHIYKKDGFYYLMIAEGGTFIGHMETIARAPAIHGPYGPNPANPILTNANTTEYYQAIGHADLFQDPTGNWWGVAHTIRVDLNEQAFPMGRETVLFPVTWEQGQWPVASPVRGVMSGWEMPSSNNTIVGVPGPLIAGDDTLDFTETQVKPSHLIYWRYPNESNYDFSPEDTNCGLKLALSRGNLSSTDSVQGGATLIIRRQSHSLFTYSIDLDFLPQETGEEAGITVFVSDRTHLELGIIRTTTNHDNGTSITGSYLRFQGASNATSVDPVLRALPEKWRNQTMTLEIKAFNATHYAFSAGPTVHESQMMTVAYAHASLVRPIFTGALLGVYATSNGRDNAKEGHVCVNHWRYQGDGQLRS